MRSGTKGAHDHYSENEDLPEHGETQKHAIQRQQITVSVN